METMTLVAGLAVAGLVGIAAAFYFSLRSGNGGDRRVRSAGAGRAGADRRPGSRSNGTARTGNARRAANGGRSANAGRGANTSSRNYRAEGGTGPHPVLDFGDPVLVGGHRGGPGAPARSRTGDAQATDPRLGAARPGESRIGSREAARLSRESHADQSHADQSHADQSHADQSHADQSHGDWGAAKTAKPRRHLGFRKGADVDEEMWPTEAFGGVTDEQFWDDLASDKPLTTTARTAQQDSGARNRPPDALPLADMQAVQALALGLGDNRARGEGRRGAGSGAYPESRTGPNPAAEPTAIQPAYTATQPSEAHGRRRASTSADEDPLTSAAFSLRASGPVDGRSSRAPRTSRDVTSEQYDSAVAQETQTFSLADKEAASGGYPTGVPPFRQFEPPASDRASEPRASGTAPYPYSGTPYGDASSVTQSVNTPRYGASYGYGNPAAQADDPRRQDGTRSPARHADRGEANRPPRQAYPRDGYEGTGGYQGTGGYPSGGYQGSGHQGNGYQGNGYQGNGRPAPYDPREDYGRLTHQR
jgi:hypothetical protein